MDLNSNHISINGGIVAVDTETTGLDPYGSAKERGGHWPARPFVISFTDYDGNSSYIRFDVNIYTRKVSYNDHYYNMAKIILEDPSITKIMHNANFDIIMLWYIGIDVKGKIFDTRIMAHVKNSGMKSFALKSLAIELLDINDEDQKDLKMSVMRRRRQGKKEGWALAEDLEADYHLGDPLCIKRYAELDTERTMGLFWGFEDYYNNDEEYKKVVDIELELLAVVRRMQLKGIRIDPDKLIELEAYYNDVITQENNRKTKLGFEGLNPNSPKQMQALFYGQLKCAPIFHKKSLTTNSSALVKWAEQHEIAQCLLRLNSAKHELDAFIIPFQKMAYVFNNKGHIAIHPNYNTVGPITGRISCNAPNLMNISSNDSAGRKTDVLYRTRELFIPREGFVFYFPDYSQIEVWLSMFLSQDKFGMQALLDGNDMHGLMAKRIWGTYENFEENKKVYRKRAKFILFGMIYGAGVSTIASTASCDMKTAAYIRDLFHDQYKELFIYSDSLIKECKTKGYITNLFGRKYYPPMGAEYKALNYMVQGTAGDVMKRAMINLYHLFNNEYRGCNLLLTIHDEAGLEISLKYHGIDCMKSIIKAMQGNFHELIGIPNPLPVGMKWSDKSWAHMQEIEV